MPRREKSRPCLVALCKKYFIKQGSYLTNKTAQNECDCRYDLVGQKIGRWTVQYLLEERTKKEEKFIIVSASVEMKKTSPQRHYVEVSLNLADVYIENSLLRDVEQQELI